MNSVSRPPARMNARQRKSVALHVARKEREEADDSLEIINEIGIPKEDNSVGMLMKARDKEMTEMETQMKNLQMQNYFLKKELEKKENQVRRLSQQNQHGFYQFDDDNSSSRRSSGRPSLDVMNDINVKRLEAQVSELESSLRSAQNEVAVAQAAKERAQYEAQRQKELRVKLDSEMDAVHAEKMMLQGDREVLKAQVGLLTDQGLEVASRLRAAEAKAGGSSKRLDKHLERERERIREAEKRANRFRDAVSLLETSIQRTESQCQDLRNRAKTTTAELVEERRIRAQLESEVNVLKHRLSEEAKRVDIENEARQHQCLSHAGKGPCPDQFRRPPMEQLEHLLRNTNVTRDYVNLKHDNLGQWRDTVLAEINDSLKLLYCFQRQVEVQRDEFVQEYARHETTFQDITNIGEKENNSYTANIEQVETSTRTETYSNQNDVKRSSMRNNPYHKTRRSPRPRKSPMTDVRTPTNYPSSSAKPSSGRRNTGRKKHSPA